MVVVSKLKIERVKNRLLRKKIIIKKKKVLTFRCIRSINKWRRGLRTLSEIVVSEEETERVMCCDLLWEEVSTIEIFLLFLPLWICQISIGAEDRGKKTPKYFFRSANPNRFSIARPDRKFSISSSLTTFYHVLRDWTQLSSPMLFMDLWIF